MSKAWAKGSTPRWRKIREQVLIRDHYLCRLKLDGCTTRATQVHHIHGKARGDDPAGLVSACEPCNLQVGDPTRSVADPPPKTHSKW